MSEVNWEYIIKMIRSDKCVLLLGPEIPVTKQGEPLHQALESYLGVQTDPDILYFNDDEFFLFKDETAKFPTYLNIQKFYTQSEIPPIYEQIAQLPLHLIISLSPDLMLRQVYEQYGLPFDFDYYRKYENPSPVKRPTEEKPLIYNLFGSVEDDESLIFTHDDMFDFLFKISNSFQLPDNIRNELRKAKNFILLGFKFEKWYVKLILRLFELHSGRFLRYAPKGITMLEPETKEWYEHLFKINFIEDKVPEFVQELYGRCEQEGMLKKLGEKRENISFAEKLRSQIQNDQLEEAIEELDDYLSQKGEKDLLDDLTLASRSHRRVQRKLKNRTVNDSDAEVKLNQIVSSLLAIVDEVKELEEPNNATG